MFRHLQQAWLGWAFFSERWGSLEQNIPRYFLVSQYKCPPLHVPPAKSFRSTFWKSLSELCNIRLHFKVSNSEQICEIRTPRYLKFWAIWQFGISLAALGETSSNKKILDKLQLIFNPESFPKSYF